MQRKPCLLDLVSKRTNLNEGQFLDRKRKLRGRKYDTGYSMVSYSSDAFVNITAIADRKADKEINLHVHNPFVLSYV